MKIGAMNHPQKKIISEINWIGQNNFDFIDLTVEPNLAEQVSLNEIKSALKRNNLEIVGHTNPHLPILSPIETIAAAAFEELEKSIEYLALLGANKVNIHPYTYSGFSLIEIFNRNITVFKKILKICQIAKVKLMLENSFSPFANYEDFKKTLNQIPDLAVHLDLGHLNLISNYQIDFEKFINEFKSKIAHVHLHDNDGTLDQHLPLGCGTINWSEVLPILKKAGYNDTITLEVFCNDRQYLLYSRDKLRRLWNK